MSNLNPSPARPVWVLESNATKRALGFHLAKGLALAARRRAGEPCTLVRCTSLEALQPYLEAPDAE